MNKKILITGDVAIDHLYHTIPQQDQGANWQLYSALQTTLQPGGAFLLTDFVKEAVKTSTLEVEVTGPKYPDDPYGPEARNMIQAKVLLKKYKEEDKKEWIRVERYYGYSSCTDNNPIIPSLDVNSDEVNLLILDDAGNGFRDHEEAFPSCINNDKTMLAYKMRRPLAKTRLSMALVTVDIVKNKSPKIFE